MTEELSRLNRPVRSDFILFNRGSPVAQFGLLSEKNKLWFSNLVAPMGGTLDRLGVHANTLSLSGLVLSAGAGWVYGAGSFFWGSWLVVLAGVCDILDGQVARRNGTTSSFGAFLDSTLDRISELLIFLGLAWFFARGAGWVPPSAPEMGLNLESGAVILILWALASSYLVSYTRARAEGLGVQCKVGALQRPERIVLLILGSWLACIPNVGPFMMLACIFIIAALSTFTVIQRMVHVNRELSRKP